MKNITALLILIFVSFTCLSSSTNSFKATCTGGSNCRACKNCKYCKHCAKDGGKCSVCK